MVDALEFRGRAVRVKDSISSDKSVRLAARGMAGCVGVVDGVKGDKVSLNVPIAKSYIPACHVDLVDFPGDSFACIEKSGGFSRSWLMQSVNEATARWVADRVLLDNLASGRFPTVEIYHASDDGGDEYSLEFIASKSIQGFQL